MASVGADGQESSRVFRGSGPKKSRRLAERIVYTAGPRGVVGLGFISTLMTIGLGSREIFDLRGPGWSKVFAWFTCLLAGAAVAGLAVLQAWHHEDKMRLERHHREELSEETKRLSRAARFSTAFPSIHEAFHTLRDADAVIRAATNGSDAGETYRPKLVSALHHFASAWSVVTGVTCRASVKELVLHDQSQAMPSEVALDTEARIFDVRHWIRSSAAPRPQLDEPTPLSENSDFMMIMDQSDDRRWFWSNDLDNERGYSNTHRRPDGPHDYNAAMVWPIQRRTGERRVRLVGFLCVDATERGVFEESDFEFGAAFADTLYSLLSAEQALRVPRARAAKSGPPASAHRH